MREQIEDCIEVVLSDVVGNEHAMQIRLPLVTVEDEPVYRFQNTTTGKASGKILSYLIESEEEHLTAEEIQDIETVRNSALTRTASNINKGLIKSVGFEPIEIERSDYKFDGLRFHREASAATNTTDELLRNINTHEHIPTPLENRLLKSGIRVNDMTLAEKRVLDSLRGRAGTHLDIEAITKLLEIDHNISADQSYVTTTLKSLLQRSQSGELSKVKFRVINGSLRVQWEPTEVLTRKQKDFNRKPGTVEGISMVPPSWRI